VWGQRRQLAYQQTDFVRSWRVRKMKSRAAALFVVWYLFIVRERVALLIVISSTRQRPTFLTKGRSCHPGPQKPLGFGRGLPPCKFCEKILDGAFVAFFLCCGPNDTANSSISD
jgi:hypothetical protein